MESKNVILNVQLDLGHERVKSLNFTVANPETHHHITLSTVFLTNDVRTYP
jgi:hypothetical protein